MTETNIQDTVVVWREIKPGVFQEFTVPKSDMKIGDVVYSVSRQFYGRITEIRCKEPGRYSDSELMLEPIPTFFAFPSVSNN